MYTMSVYMFTHTDMHTHTPTRILKYAYICVHTYRYIHDYMTSSCSRLVIGVMCHVYTCKQIHIYTHAHVHIHVHVYSNTHIYTYTHINIYIYTYGTSVLASRCKCHTYERITYPWV